MATKAKRAVAQETFNFNIACPGQKGGGFGRVGGTSATVAKDEISMVLKAGTEAQRKEFAEGAFAIVDATEGHSLRAFVILKDGRVIKSSRPASDIQADLMKVG